MFRSAAIFTTEALFDLKLYLPQDKIDKTVSACSSLISTASPTIRQVAQVTGLLVSAFPAVPYLRLYYRSIESCKSRCLFEHNGDHDQHILLSSDALADLNWVIHNFSQYNGCYFGPKPISLIIASDASLLGWGATCDGQPAQGQWSTLEVSHHINYLELLAAFYALQTFAANAQNLHVQLKLDNSTAISYINNMAGSKSDILNSLARQLWEWCMKRNIFISAQHIPGHMNSAADQLSRTFSYNLEWSLNTNVFQQITQLTLVPDIDLFASSLNAKLSRFVS